MADYNPMKIIDLVLPLIFTTAGAVLLSGSPTGSLSRMHAIHCWPCSILLCKQGMCGSCYLCPRLFILRDIVQSTSSSAFDGLG